MITVTVQIGNSDNKLTQQLWSIFVNKINDLIKSKTRVHFFGGSDSFAPWQNACWVVELDEEDRENLFSNLSMIRREFGQDAIAVTTGQTIMI